MNSHNALAETYQNEFEKRNNGERLNNPALDWQTVTVEVAMLDNRNAGNGYMVYSQQRIFENKSHEQAMEYLNKVVIWR